MTARLLDGVALSRKLRSAIALRVAALAAAASQIYVRNKVRACEEAGMLSRMHLLPAETSERDLLDVIDTLNDDPAIHGILVQMPLPQSIDATRAIEAVSIGKDVDGFHLLSAGALLTGRIDAGVGFRPCTPFGVMRMLDDAAVPIAGAEAVVIGRSNTVGKPMAAMLLARDATVTICHRATRNLAETVRRADIVVAAVGRASTVTAAMVKPGAAVIDVGINRRADGKLVGDVDFEAVREVAGWISPVPGGVGPMTITMLLENTVLSAERTLPSY